MAAKYRKGDTFRERGIRGYGWWRVDGVREGPVEPEYDLSFRPLGNTSMTLSESALDEKYYNTTKSGV